MVRAWTTCLGAFAAWAAFAAPAHADRNEPLPVSSASPANGATLMPGQVAFEVSTPLAHLGLADIEVSTQPILGQDGTLANDFQQDLISLSESDAFPGTYRGTAGYIPSGYWWDSNPGTYFWQVAATEFQTTPPFEVVHYVGPIFTLTIVPANQAPAQSTPSEPTNSPSPGATATLSLSEAYEVVRQIIRARSGHYARRLKDRCVKQSQEDSVCRASWVAPLPLTSRSWIYAGRFELEAEGESINYDFRGERVQWRCVRRRNVKACARAVHW